MIHNYTATDYFGDDGMGDFDFDREVSGSVDRSKNAAVAMVDLVKKYPGKIAIKKNMKNYLLLFRGQVK